MKSLYAVCLLVEDFDRSIDYYTRVLDLSINSRDGKYADFKIGDTLLAIFEKSEATAMFPKSHMTRGGGCVLAYQVDDVAKACETLKQKGIDIFEGPKTTPWGQTVAYFKDPDNTIWEITS